MYMFSKHYTWQPCWSLATQTVKYEDLLQHARNQFHQKQEKYTHLQIKTPDPLA